jgi:DNA invertase Pin-like site-specific DNA recombinase
MRRMKAATQPASVTGDLPTGSAKGSLRISMLDDSRLKERGIDIISLTEKTDMTTPGGKLIFHMMEALSRV